MFDFTLAPYAADKMKKTVIVFAEDKAVLTSAAKDLNKKLDNLITHSAKNSRFQGGLGEILHVTPASDSVYDRVVVYGLGKAKEMTQSQWWKLGVKLGKTVDSLGVTEATIALDKLSGKEKAPVAVSSMLEGLHVGLYRFNKFLTQTKPHQAYVFKKFAILTTDEAAKKLKSAKANITGLGESVNLARELVNLPPNVANPQYMAEEAQKLKSLGVKVTVLDEKKLASLGMNLMMAVGSSASKADQPRLVIMEYNGGKKGDPVKAIVGKGVMYDTGGYNLKPSAYMGGMKCDMGGAAAVLGAMRALAARKAKVNVVGVCGCVMNMVGETPFLPDSIYTSYKGLTIEIGNTDAEGRLVLADAVAYTIDKYKPAEVIDLATLTGAIMVALGGAYGGLFSTNDKLAEKLRTAGNTVGERLWRMPLDDCFAAKSKIADADNDGNPYGGSSTAALFIKKFVDDKTPWAHLDIAGVVLAEKKPVPGMLEVDGATGFGVRLLTHYFENN